MWHKRAYLPALHEIRRRADPRSRPQCGWMRDPRAYCSEQILCWRYPVRLHANGQAKRRRPLVCLSGLESEVQVPGQCLTAYKRAGRTNDAFSPKPLSRHRLPLPLRDHHELLRPSPRRRRPRPGPRIVRCLSPDRGGGQAQSPGRLLKAVSKPMMSAPISFHPVPPIPPIPFCAQPAGLPAARASRLACSDS